MEQIEIDERIAEIEQDMQGIAGKFSALKMRLKQLRLEKQALLLLKNARQTRNDING